MSQIISKQRVANFGEVYTNSREVNAMLDLIQHQSERVDARFLEPACGVGNFLIEILKRKLHTVTKKYSKNQAEYEKQALIAVSSLYGIELLLDNIILCRNRLLTSFRENYLILFPKTYNDNYLKSISYILSTNLIQGDALSLKDQFNKNLIFPEWSFVNNNYLKRRDFIYPDLVNKSSERELPLFSDLGDEAFIAEPIKDYPLIHFLEVGNV